MPIQKLYNYTIDFVEDTMLSKPTKVYLLSLAEKTLLTYGSMRNSERDIFNYLLAQ